LFVTISSANYTLTANDSSAPLTATSQSFNVNSPPAFNFHNIASLSQAISPTSEGISPGGSLYMDSNGNLFGTTATGGAYGYGTVFEIAEPSNAYSTLVSFTGNGGAYSGADPLGLTSDGRGNLLGTTQGGGSSNDGTIFELAGSNHAFSSILSFTGIVGNFPGEIPEAGLTSDGNGNLFGTTEYGGTYSDGTVFELIGSSHSFSSVHTFNFTDGAYPLAPPAPDGIGDIFGTTSGGGTSSDGSVYELAGSNHTFSSVHSFSEDDGASPGDLTPVGNGDLLGTTGGGGWSNAGTVFEVFGASHSVNTVQMFTEAGGVNPEGPLISDGNGNFFGTAQNGGNSSDGIVYELTGSSYTPSKLFSFTGTSGANPGANPEAGLIIDGNGNLFGTTLEGGTFGYGTVFEIPAAARGTLINLISFSGGNGDTPEGAVFVDSSGNVFGTTSLGGAYGDGSVFEITEPSGVYSTLVSFTGTAGAYLGASPEAGLTSDGNGNLFGTTNIGGTSNAGTVFELAGSSHTFSSILSFTGNTGAYPGSNPRANLASDGNGNLFGTTYEGGSSNDGTVFELAGPSNTFSSLLSFTGNSGNYPGAYSRASLISDGNGNLFGTTVVGGTSSDGTVFELAGTSHTFSSLFSFTGNTGAYAGADPDAGLTSDGKGNFFGTTSIGGTSGEGTLFELAGPSHAYSTLLSFPGNNGASLGAYPEAGLTSDGNGNLFGTTLIGGGTSGDGLVFELAGSNHVFSTLFSFSGNINTYPGADPLTSLTLDANGDLFGTTSESGATSIFGTVFELTPSTKLSFATPPSGATVGTTLSSIRVNIEQSSGSITTGDSSIITLSIQSGPVGAVLEGTTSVAAVNGVATFTNLSLSIPGNYTLIATDGSLSPATSNTFTIQPLTATWTGAADGLNWSNPGNWSGDLVPTAYTDVTIASGFTVKAGSGAYSVDSLTTSSPIEITAGATLQLFGPATFTSSLTIDTNATLKVTADPVLLVVNGSAFTNNGTIDIGTNDMIIHNGNLTQITPGLFSSSASTSTTLAIELNNDGHGNPLMTTFDNQTVTTTDVLVKYTYFGDTNLDGSVTAADYLAIDNAFSFNSTNPTTPLTGWDNGDFNYDGLINGDDYTLIDNAFNSQSTVPLVSPAQATSSPNPIILQATALKRVATSPAIAQTESSTPIWPFDSNPLDKRKPSLANEIFTD
jgi:uncharacterized repeat protein (TIGR03803 family)